MKFKIDTMYIGLSLGLVLPALLMLLYWRMNYSLMSLDEFMRFTTKGQIHVKLISLFTVVNLGLFFLFILGNFNLAARGVLGATFLYALLVLIVKFL